jgi:hypothetical protein
LPLPSKRPWTNWRGKSKKGNIVGRPVSDGFQICSELTLQRCLEYDPLQTEIGAEGETHLSQTLNESVTALAPSHNQWY